MVASPVGIVRWMLAAFDANPEATDDELADMLAEAELPNAVRAVLMLPLAYGRRILDGLVTVSPTYFDGDRELVLADDPLFAAAAHLAQTEATRADLERVGRRSSEVDAVNQALHAGSEPADLVLSPPMMTIRERAVAPHPAVETILDELVRAHGSSLSLSARQFPGSITRGRVQLQLDVVTRVGDRELVESFGGFGATIPEAIGDAIHKLTAGTLHVLMATLDRRELGGDQVEWEVWGDFDVCLGNLLRMWSPGGPPTLTDYLHALEAALRTADLPPVPHWVRTYLATNGTEPLGFDMLVDNETWPPGEALVRAWPWPVASSYYALRHFFMLVPRRGEQP